ncbi:hypothetical protein ACFE04_007816 [Oxalis oulophora]
MIKNLSKSCRFLRIPYYHNHSQQSKSNFKIFDNTNTNTTITPNRHHRSFNQQATPPKDVVPKNATTNKTTTTTGFIGWYLSKLESNPLTTKAISASFIFTAADLTSQYYARLLRNDVFKGRGIKLGVTRAKQTKMIISQPAASYDSLRTLRMAAYGLAIMGPSQHVWFNYLSRILPQRDLLTTLTKILMGQISVIVFLSQLVLIPLNSGESGTEIAARLKRDLVPTLINGLKYWPMCDFLMFKFVPVRLQPLVNCTFAYVWTIYLTYMASLKGVTAEAGA